MYNQTCVKINQIITNNIRDIIYWHGTGIMSSFLNNPLQDLLASIQDIILIILFRNLKILHILFEFPPPQNSMYINWVKVSKVYHL